MEELDFIWTANLECLKVLMDKATANSFLFKGKEIYDYLD